MGRSTYTDADKARVYVVLQTNEGNVKRTARDTQTPENTVRRWKKEWEENGPPALDEVEQAVTDYVGEMERTRNLALQRMHERLEQDKGTLPQIATVFGVLSDKVNIARGIGQHSTVEHKHTLPTPDEIRATLGALVQGTLDAHVAREADIVDAEFTEQPTPALPRGTR